MLKPSHLVADVSSCRFSSHWLQSVQPIYSPLGSTQWVVREFGDVYPHETVISRIRRLLEDDFVCRGTAPSSQ